MDYKQAFIEALTNKELVSNYDRLFESNLTTCLKAMSKGGINYQIDLATGRTKDEIQKFNDFFFEYIWARLPQEAFKD